MREKGWRVMRVLKIILMIIVALLGVVFVSSPETRLVGVAFFLFVLAGFAAFLNKKYGKVHEPHYSEKTIKLVERGIKAITVGVHMSGLPIGEGALCEIYATEEKVIFAKDGTEYNLELEKITDVTMKTDTEIREAYVSNAGGAVSGALLFGSLGAIIGGQPVKETTKTIRRYLILTYRKNDGIDFVSFDVTPFLNTVPEFEQFVRERINAPASVDL